MCPSPRKQALPKGISQMYQRSDNKYFVNFKHLPYL